MRSIATAGLGMLLGTASMAGDPYPHYSPSKPKKASKDRSKIKAARKANRRRKK